MKKTGIFLSTTGIVGIILGAVGGVKGSIYTAVYIATVLFLGYGAIGAVLSAIFHLTNARWGRPYMRLAEAFAAAMPVGLAGLAVILAGGDAFLPWTNEPHLTGGKHIWLTRGFWDLRVIFMVLVAYSAAFYFIYHSIRRDFCSKEVSENFRGGFSTFFSRGISDPDRESMRCETRLSRSAPVVIIIYALFFSFLGFDLIMALEPQWVSTLFGAWYFMGNIFSGLAFLIIISIAFGEHFNLDRFTAGERQADIATLLFGFTLINIDFFWSQYLTIWYGNLPEETGYIISRTIDSSLPWRNLSWFSIACFFALPFIALLFRGVKKKGVFLLPIAVAVIAGIFSARFLEIAPPILREANGGDATLALPLIIALLIFCGFCGAALLLYDWFLSRVPAMPVGDKIFRTLSRAE